MSQLMLSMLGAVYQFERSIMLERQREGIAKAKAAGKFKGRPATLDTDAIIESLDSGVSIRKTAAALGVSVSSVARAAKARSGQPCQ
jgi:DNA invertase Pin-like site-specific DNA recombinase